jgi:DNA excision repair protein ERCC-5
MPLRSPSRSSAPIVSPIQATSPILSPSKIAYSISPEVSLREYPIMQLDNDLPDDSPKAHVPLASHVKLSSSKPKTVRTVSQAEDPKVAPEAFSSTDLAGSPSLIDSKRNSSPLTPGSPGTRSTNAFENDVASPGGVARLVEEDEGRSPTPTPNEPEITKPEQQEDLDIVDDSDEEVEELQSLHYLNTQTENLDLDQMQVQAEQDIISLTKEQHSNQRNSDEVTIQMNKEIQNLLQYFGIPYITAPMEAEAQCAALFQQQLVDGIITDDSDVFLFGGSKIYKNMFNQNKYVECYLLSDLESEIGLDQRSLICLAHFLGSDYTEGIAGVGPILGMELLKEFPGTDGLTRFKEWWTKVQSGRDGEDDTSTDFRRNFKRLKKDSLHLDPEFPNPAVVSNHRIEPRVNVLMGRFYQMEAYLRPAVDSSKTEFSWDFPDLDGLRRYLTFPSSELSHPTE